MPAAPLDAAHHPVRSAARVVRGVFARAPFTAVLWLVVLGGGVATGALSGSVGHEPWFAAL
ncbi:hypothetical protein ACIPVK_10210, partial [Paeniglutamicibacter sp. MACA_103]|uniref:hypothetical protein n=1 Tax=Paeniglutamicibacter sp. MACA_103 TaxID=3377337 RepID=UPI0038961A35